MIRTQIYFDKNLYINLKYCAKTRGISMSEYIRQMLSNKIESDPKLKKKKINPLLKLANLAKKDPVSKKLINISQNIDKYLPEELR